jgi:hypothetical protein
VAAASRLATDSEAVRLKLQLCESQVKMYAEQAAAAQGA